MSNCTFKSRLHFLHFWGTEMLEAGWLGCLKASIHCLPHQAGSFQVLEQHPTTLPLRVWSWAHKGYFNIHLSRSLNKYMPQIKQKAVLPVIFLPRIPEDFFSLVSPHTQFIPAYLTSLEILWWFSPRKCWGNLSLSLPLTLNTELKTCTQTDQCTSKHNEAQ